MTDTQARAVRLDEYGGLDALYVADIPMPKPAPGEVIVELRAAGINPGEAGIRSGAMHDWFPAIDLFGPEYLDLAVEIGVSPDRIETGVPSGRVMELGAKTEGSVNASTREILAELADLVTTGEIQVPIAATYPRESVADAFAELERRHTRGKILLIP